MATEEETQTVTVEAEPAQEAPQPPFPDAPDAMPEDKPLDAVIVVKTTDNQGNIVTEVYPNGDVRPTEVETVIKLGLKKWQSQLGL